MEEYLRVADVNQDGGHRPRFCGRDRVDVRTLAPGGPVSTGMAFTNDSSPGYHQGFWESNKVRGRGLRAGTKFLSPLDMIPGRRSNAIGPETKDGAAVISWVSVDQELQGSGTEPPTPPPSAARRQGGPTSSFAPRCSTI
jgi:hypothetical protein